MLVLQRDELDGVLAGLADDTIAGAIDSIRAQLKRSRSASGDDSELTTSLVIRALADELAKINAGRRKRVATPGWHAEEIVRILRHLGQVADACDLLALRLRGMEVALAELRLTERRSAIEHFLAALAQRQVGTGDLDKWRLRDDARAVLDIADEIEADERDRRRNNGRRNGEAGR